MAQIKLLTSVQGVPGGRDVVFGDAGAELDVDEATAAVWADGVRAIRLRPVQPAPKVSLVKAVGLAGEHRHPSGAAPDLSVAELAAADQAAAGARTPRASRPRARRAR